MTTQESIILYNSVGSQTFSNSVESIEEDYDEASLTGTKSIYVVYDVKNFNKDNFNFPSRSEIVDSVDRVELKKRPPRSLQGFNSTGIILFQGSNYGWAGVLYEESIDDILESFPTGQKGVSSFIVMEGKWALFTDINHTGTQLSIEGVSEFVPGMRVPTMENDKVRSVKRLE